MVRRMKNLSELRVYGSAPFKAVVIHGDYDPHPFEGVQGPLSPILKEFRFFLLKNCGHYPWLEREARERFF